MKWLCIHIYMHTCTIWRHGTVRMRSYYQQLLIVLAIIIIIIIYSSVDPCEHCTSKHVVHLHMSHMIQFGHVFYLGHMMNI